MSSTGICLSATAETAKQRLRERERERTSGYHAKSIALLPGETCEHIDGDRDSEHASNLIPRFGLFQANARKIHKFVVDGKTTGVTLMHDARCYRASVRMYTPDSYRASMGLHKYFWKSQSYCNCY
jgi:hypothetical protein